MTNTKTLGRADDNDVKFTDPHIGRHHAKITSVGDGSFIVEDMESLSGTFVNGYRVSKAIIMLKDKVQLADTPVNVAEIFGIRVSPEFSQVKKDPKDFSEEFLMLKKVYDDYKKTRKNIIQSHQRKSSLIRAAIMISPLPIYYLIQSYVPAGTYLPISVTASTIAVYVAGNISSSDQLESLDENFCVTYVCPNPNCSTYLGHIPWSVYQKQGKCHRCGCIYTKK